MKLRLLFFFALCAFCHSSFAQKESVSMSNIFQIAAKKINMVEMELGCEIVRLEFDIVSTQKSTYRNLFEGYNYSILALSDDRISDIDIRVYKWVKNKWILMAQDNDNHPNALVSITPAFTGEYQIVISAYKFEPGYDQGHYALMIYHE